MNSRAQVEKNGRRCGFYPAYLYLCGQNGLAMENITLIKVGGKIVEEERTLGRLLDDFARIRGAKALVHGGGRLATRVAEQLGVESRMVEGRRITDAETLRIVTMVYAGLVNKNIVARLQALNVDAIGLTGADMNVMRSEKRPVREVDYGFVGDVKEVNAGALTMLLKNGYVPVLSPLTHDRRGNLLNTNADTIAGEAAGALARSFDVTLVFCFEKSGVLCDEQDDASVIPALNREMFDEYRRQGIIRGGMIPKLENSFRAIDAGVRRVIITRAEDICGGAGTVISN
jgi:acetylglutamate kinase